MVMTLELEGILEVISWVVVNFIAYETLLGCQADLGTSIPEILIQ